MNLLNPVGKDHLVWAWIAAILIILLVPCIFLMIHIHAYWVLPINIVGVLLNMNTFVQSMKKYAMWKYSNNV